MYPFLCFRKVKKGYTNRNRAENRDFWRHTIQNYFDLVFITNEVYFKKLKKIIGGGEAQQTCTLQNPGIVLSVNSVTNGGGNLVANVQKEEWYSLPVHHGRT